MAVAVFCLQQAGQAIAVVAAPEGASLDDPESMPEFDQIESYILHLQHVYKPCCILNGNWPSVFPRAARSTANTFIQRWKVSAGEDLRAAFTHFEEALADPDHRLRGDPRSNLRVRGIDIPFFGAEYHRVGTPQDVLEKGPDRVQLIGKDYRLERVYEALVELEREFSAVLRHREAGVLRGAV